MTKNCQEYSERKSSSQKVEQSTDLEGRLKARKLLQCEMRGEETRKGRSVGAFIARLVERNVPPDLAQKCVGSTIKLIESVLWPFVVSRASRRDGAWYDRRELRQLDVSVAHIVREVHRHAEHSENRDQSFIKYWTDLAMCQVFKDEAKPPRPSWIDTPLFVGCLKRAVAMWVNRGDLSRVYSLSKGIKRLWPKLGDAKRNATLDKHKERFSEAVASPIPNELRSAVRTTARMLFLNGKKNFFNLTSDPTKVNPSTSACLQSSRENGGCAALFAEFDPRQVPTVFNSRYVDEQYQKWRNDTWKEACANVAVRVASGDSSVHDMKVVAIAEPAKYRIITKMDGYLATAVQPLQGVLLDLWKHSKYSTMLHDDCTDLVRAIDNLNTEDEFFCSVDYEAATDLLRRETTWAVMEVLQASPLGWLGAISFMGGKVTYPDGSVIENEERQPMGHPLSFPILCCVNLAVYRYTCFDEAHRRFPDNAKARRAWLKMRLEAVAVNGDDMLFKCDRDFYARFINVAREVGLHISVGKNYLSRRMCMINSQVFRREGNRMVRQGYLNLKFVTGSSVKTGESAATPDQIGPAVERMISHAHWTSPVVPDVFQRWATWRFLYPGFRPNWYLPLHLGGLGLVPRASTRWHSVKYTAEQRRVARAFVLEPGRISLCQRRPSVRGLSLTEKFLPDESETIYIRRFGTSSEALHVLEDAGFKLQSAQSSVNDWSTRMKMYAKAYDPAQFSRDFVPKGRLMPRREQFELGLRGASRTGAQRIPPFSADELEQWRDIEVYVKPLFRPPPLRPVLLKPVGKEFFDVFQIEAAAQFLALRLLRRNAI